ncbi:MAG: excinuclease ABC subunit UvrC [Nitrospinota bacterium]|nr:excinuclease ABC subunit UvrC [Nitrospinota bacterium]
MNKRLAHILDQLPFVPGIYMMKDKNDKILYIGKAKSLSHRVRSYFQESRTIAPRTRVMVSHVHDIQVLTTQTEGEALILESNFVKKYQPRYNVLLKDDKHFPYLRLTTQEEFPRLEVVRRIRKDGAMYFGPYTMVKEVRETIRLIYKILPLRQSRDELDGSKKRRPCLNYQIGRCLGPCAGNVPPTRYATVVNDVILFLKGKNSELLESLKTKMDAATLEFRYEEAAVYRDKIKAVKTVFDRQNIISPYLEDQDVIACHCEGGCAMVQALIIRGGKMIGERIFKMRSQREMLADEILSSFVKQYYSNEAVLPREILLPQSIEDLDLVADWFSGKKGHRVRLDVPQRGKKRRLVEMAEENARRAVKNEIESDEACLLMMEELQTMLNLKSLPQTIEAFDISNISGTHSVGSLACFSDARANKSQYRSFQIRDVQGIDDYQMMREVLVRRYGRLIEEEKPMPDMILIDGGRGHLNKAQQVLLDLGLEDKIDLISIAKGRDRGDLATDEVLSVSRKIPVVFKKSSPARFLLQRIRDEAHRFSIHSHRKLRTKKSLVSPLETISGIGKKRRLLLLKKFGSLENIRNASLDDLKTIPGITENLARKISDQV